MMLFMLDIVSMACGLDTQPVLYILRFKDMKILVTT